MILDDRDTVFRVVHPLDDAPEQKVETGNLGLMPLTRGARASLMALRAYVALIMMLVVYHALDLAGTFGPR